MPFEAYRDKAYPEKYRCTLHIHELTGGIPSDPKIVANWLRSRFEERDETIARLVQETMQELGSIEIDKAVEHLVESSTVNTFKRFPDGTVYLEGRCVKAMLKEAANIAVDAGRIPQRIGGSGGKYARHPRKWIAEHVFVVEDRIPLHIHVDDLKRVTRPISVLNRQGRFTALKASHIAEDVKITFHVVSDGGLSEEVWAHIWLTAQQNGLGADRSQGSGRFRVIEWEPVDSVPEVTPA